MKDYLLVSVGNSNSQVALACGSSILSLETFPTSQFFETEGLPEPFASGARLPILVACVVPAVKKALKAATGGGLMQFLTADLVTEVDFSGVEALSIGADRLANAVAAVTLGALPLIVIDCGTAITTEVVDGHGVFRGGAIAPGRLVLRRALNSFTGQLPEIPMTDHLPAALGTTTVDAITAGCDLGAVGTVARLIEESRRELGQPDCRAIAIGGDAPYFAQCLPELDLGPDDFTFRGLATVAARIFA